MRDYDEPAVAVRNRRSRGQRLFVDRVVDQAVRSLGALGASCAIWRAICAASALGAGERASRNEQVVGSIPTGGSQRSSHQRPTRTNGQSAGIVELQNDGNFVDYGTANPSQV